MVTRRQAIGGIAGIIAAQTAPAFGLVGAAGAVSPRLRQLIGARWAAMGGARKFTARDYVQDGLVTMWDGIINTGRQHFANIQDWTDIVSGNTIHLVGNYSVGDDCVIFNPEANNSGGAYGLVEKYVNFTMLEVVMRTLAPNGNITQIVFVKNGYWNDGVYIGSSIKDGNWYHEVCRYRCPIIRLPYDFGGSTRPRFSFSTGRESAYLNGVQSIGTNHGSYKYSTENMINCRNNGGVLYGGYKCEYMSIRAYSRDLTAEEVAHNYAVDKARFNLA